MQLCFFSDMKGQRLDPLTLSRPVHDIRVGIYTIQEKWEKWLKKPLVSHLSRSYLREVFPSQDPSDESPCLWINARVLPNKELIEELINLPLGHALVGDSKDPVHPKTAGSIEAHQELLAIKVPAQKSIELHEHYYGSESGKTQFLEPLYSSFDAFHVTQSSFSIVDYLWEILELNGTEIASDLMLIEVPTVEDHELRSNLHVMHPEHIFIHPTAHLEPGVILVAEEGPIYIGAHAKIEAGSILKGPLAICASSVTKMGCRIYGGTTIGPVSKVGGEVSNTIFHSYSNKAHDGYMGNSLVGQWCNMGADSNTSNLKTNYGLIYLEDWTSREAYPVGFQFFGSVLGDHSKTAINAMLNTGTMCGVCSNIFLSQFTPKHIPSFSWLTDHGDTIYRFDKAVEAMRAMMARRDVVYTEAYERMMRHLFEEQQHDKARA